MSRQIDERVVSMQFDNRQFESNVSTTMSSLDKLKNSLNLKGATKGLESIDYAAKKVDMSPLGSAVEKLSLRFSALEVMGVTALGNITNSALNAAKKMASALTIDPIKTGFQEYETQINAVQTILANTESKGTTLQNVNSALDTLNTYADKTIYNFTEMTKNIGTFTAAGVDLETSVSAIQGIANLAAVSGSTSQQASTAMYQLSQALSSGTVKLMDWNSVVNAGMGGQVFQDALKQTARVHGVAIDKMIKDEGSFRETLKNEWLTADILTETLNQFTMAAEEGSEEWNAYKKSLMDDGYTEKQAVSILKMANTATDAATKVKTVTQLWDTMKESVQSGWTQTWEIILGDFGEAKDFLTDISDKMGGMIGGLSDSRNALLSEGLSSGWKQLLGAGIADEEGYKETFKSVAEEHGVYIDKMIKAEKKLDESLTDSEAFAKVLKKGFTEGTLSSDMLSESVHKMAGKMSKMSAEELKAAGYTSDHVKQIKELSAGLKNGSISMDDFVNKITRTSGRENIIQALWNSFNGLMSVLKPIKEAFREVFKPLTGDQLYSFTESLVEFTKKLTLSGEKADKIKRIFKGLFSIFDIVKKIVTSVTSVLFDFSQSDGISGLADLVLDIAAAVGDFFTSINKSFDSNGLIGMLSSITSTTSGLLESLTGGLSGVGDILSSITGWFSRSFGKVLGLIKEAVIFLSEHISAGDIFAGLVGGGIFKMTQKGSKFLENLNETFSNLFDKGKGLSGIKDKIVETLDGVSDALKAFTTGVKVWSILGIAVAIAVLTSALEKLSTLRVSQLAKSLLAVGLMISMLMFSFKSITKSLTKFESKGVLKSALSLILIAKAVDILADAMLKVSGMSMEEIGKSLVAMGGALLELCAAIKIIGKTKTSLSSSIALVALAHSCAIIADALQKFGDMSWSEIRRGLSAMGGALGELVGTIAILNKVGGGKSLLASVGLLIAVQSLSELSDALKKFGEMAWDEIGRGLSAMGGALVEVGGVIAAVGKIAGFSSIFAAASIGIVIQGLSDMADALWSFGDMSWGEIRRGLSAMGGALGEVGAITGALGKLAGFSSLFGAGAIWITIQGLGDLAAALQQFGNMSWSEIGRGLVAMGGALLEVGAITGALGYLTNIAGIFGAATIWIAVQGLSDLATAFQQFGSMSWSEIGRGLVAMGGALLEVGGISGALGYLTNIAGLLGAATIWTAVQGLGDLADALKKFGEMSWDEIGRGLSAMGAALGEVALGSLANTLSFLGASSIAKVAEPLGTLADSVKKWKDVTVPEGLGWQLTRLASGIFSFTLDGMGASAIAKVAEPLGILADSVKKWKDVTVPEGIGGQLDALSDGVFSFTLDGMGASAIAKVAGPLGTMADSVKKWAGVTVPENIGTDLSNIASGIRSFTWAFAGGWSIGSIVGPLSKLPEAISKWKDVTIPATLTKDLTGLADGITAFSFAFMSGWSIGSITGPLSDLANAVKKWKDVTVPEGLKDSLKSIADGISEFGLLDMATLQTVDDNILSLSKAFKNFASVKVNGDMLVKVAKNIKTCGTELSGLNTSSIDTAVSAVNKLVNALKKTTSVDASKVKQFVSSANSLNKINISDLKVDTSKLSSVINSIKGVMSSISKTISGSKGSLTKAMTTAVSGMANAISGKKTDMVSSANKLTDAIVKAVKGKKNSVTSAFKTLVSGAAGAVKAQRSSLESAGKDLGSGLVAGINAKQNAVYKAAYKLGQKAVQGEKDGQKSNSPSKLTIKSGKWFGEGLVIGIEKMGNAVYNAGSKLGKTATSSLSTTLSRITDIVNTDINSQPTIRPVLDLSDVRAGAGSISGLFNMNPSVGVLANVNGIKSMMNRNQNGSNDDVVSAIKDLKKSIGNASGDTYYFGDVRYDDDSSISNAVKTIVRAAKVERRA